MRIEHSKARYVLSAVRNGDLETIKQAASTANN